MNEKSVNAHKSKKLSKRHYKRVVLFLSKPKKSYKYQYRILNYVVVASQRNPSS
jgi:uncharacterized protein (DUF1919 family)